jgi:competence ComEA-like helix-hairpin-helix protein
VPNINSATLQEIAQVDFVGTSFASAIVSLRERLGAFERWEQLRQIEGLKANKIAELQRTFRLGPTH